MAFYYFCNVKTAPGPRGVMTKSPDIPAGIDWAGYIGTANIPQVPNGTEMYGIQTLVAIPDGWPGVQSATKGNFRSWQVRCGDKDSNQNDHWLGA